jgi:hypothetical protein
MSSVWLSPRYSQRMPLGVEDSGWRGQGDSFDGLCFWHDEDLPQLDAGRSGVLRLASARGYPFEALWRPALPRAARRVSGGARLSPATVAPDLI